MAGVFFFDLCSEIAGGFESNVFIGGCFENNYCSLVGKV